MENCSKDFRDVWWQIDPAVTGSMTPALDDLCFSVHSSGQLEITNYSQDWHKFYDWECVDDGIDTASDTGMGLHPNTDFYHVFGQGNALMTRLPSEDSWMMDINFKAGLISKSAELWPCYWDILTEEVK
ncbi:MAG: hypothetical protein ACXABY_04970 [Candidatus Thorarchaeota archaeon]|jgi:hypothetical protein